MPELFDLGRQACLDVIAQQIGGSTHDLDYVGTYDKKIDRSTTVEEAWIPSKAELALFK